MCSTLREENSKTVYESGYIDHKSIESEANFHSCYGSLAEGDKRNQITLDLHLLGGNSSPETWIVCEFREIRTAGFDPVIPRCQHLLNGERTEFSQKEPPVLVDVCQFIQDGEARCSGLTVPIRLKQFYE